MAPQTELIDETGRVVFRGTQSPGGGSMPVQAVYFGSAVTIADGADAALTWDILGDGDDLLDRSDLAFPTFLAAGFYSIMAVVLTSAPLTAGGAAAVSVNGPAANATNSGHDTDLGLEVIQVCHYAAGESPSVGVLNHDGVASRDFNIESCVVVKLA